MAKKYGRLPPVPTFTAKVRGDAGVYKVWGIDWLNQRVLVERAGLEWIPAEKIALDPLVSSAAGSLSALLRDLREQVAGDIESPGSSEPEHSQQARLLVARIDAMLDLPDSDPLQVVLALQERLAAAEARAEEAEARKKRAYNGFERMRRKVARLQGEAIIPCEEEDA